MVEAVAAAAATAAATAAAVAAAEDCTSAADVDPLSLGLQVFSITDVLGEDTTLPLASLLAAAMAFAAAAAEAAAEAAAAEAAASCAAAVAAATVAAFDLTELPVLVFLLRLRSTMPARR